MTHRTSRPRSLFALVVALLAALAPAGASAQSLNLRDLLTDLISQGILLAPPASGINHQAHFTGRSGDQFLALGQLSDEVSRQVSTYPISSSAGGFAYELDPALGVLTRPTRSFGPIFSERPLTIGKGKYNIGVNMSTFSFDDLDALNVADGDMRLVFVHSDENHDGSHLSPFFEGDLITARLFMGVDSDIRTIVATYGVTDRFDFGLAIPFVDVEVRYSAEAQIQRLSTGGGFEDTHVFRNGSDTQVFARQGDASGIGDVVLRAKYQVARSAMSAVALTGDVRLPTGDERDLLGTGSTWVKGALIGFLNTDPVAPHVNLGYAVSSGDAPNELSYTLGFDWVVEPRLTIAADLLGRNLSDMPTVEVEDRTFLFNTSPSGAPVVAAATFSALDVEAGTSRNALSGSVGFKMNVYKNLLLSANGLFPLNDVGLRDNFSPLIALDYSF
jgi:hypothetical protein